MEDLENVSKYELHNTVTVYKEILQSSKYCIGDLREHCCYFGKKKSQDKLVDKQYTQLTFQIISFIILKHFKWVWNLLFGYTQEAVRAELSGTVTPGKHKDLKSSPALGK